MFETQITFKHNINNIFFIFFNKLFFSLLLKATPTRSSKPLQLSTLRRRGLGDIETKGGPGVDGICFSLFFWCVLCLYVVFCMFFCSVCDVCFYFCFYFCLVVLGLFDVYCLVVLAYFVFCCSSCPPQKMLLTIAAVKALFKLSLAQEAQKRVFAGDFLLDLLVILLQRAFFKLMIFQFFPRPSAPSRKSDGKSSEGAA